MSNAATVATPTITISPEQLKTMIADAIAADRATNGSGVSAANLDTQGLGEAIAAGIAKSTRRRVTIGEYAQRPTARHPLGPAGPKLKRDCYQNGFRLYYSNLDDHQIELLNRITHSGRYVNRMVEVILNADSSEEVIDIRYKNRTRDQMFELKNHTRNFTDMLEQIVKAQEEEDRIDAERTAKPRRHFGDNKTMREALEKAEA